MGSSHTRQGNDCTYQCQVERAIYLGIKRNYSVAIEDLEKVEKLIIDKGKVMPCSISENKPASKDKEHHFWEKLAQVYYSVGKYKESLSIYRRLYGEQNMHVLKGIGDCHRQMGQYEEAHYAFRAALRHCEGLNRPDLLAEILNSQGLIYIINNQFGEAAALFEKAVSIYEENPLFHCNLALSYIELRRKEKATQRLEIISRLLLKVRILSRLSIGNLKYIFDFQKGFSTKCFYYFSIAHNKESKARDQDIQKLVKEGQIFLNQEGNQRYLHMHDQIQAYFQRQFESAMQLQRPRQRDWSNLSSEISWNQFAKKPKTICQINDEGESIFELSS